MEFSPREKFSYNQTNYLLLQKIIEKVSGQSYIDFVTQRQLDVVNMRHTYFGGFSDIIYDPSSNADKQPAMQARMPPAGQIIIRGRTTNKSATFLPVRLSIFPRTPRQGTPSHTQLRPICGLVGLSCVKVVGSEQSQWKTQLPVEYLAADQN